MVAVAGREPVRALGRLGELRVAHVDDALLGRVQIQAGHEMAGVIRAPGGHLAARGQGAGGLEAEARDEAVVDEVGQGRAVDADDTCGESDRDPLVQGGLRTADDRHNSMMPGDRQSTCTMQFRSKTPMMRGAHHLSRPPSTACTGYRAMLSASWLAPSNV